MMMNPDQPLALARNQLAAFTALGQCWLDCSEQLAALQLEAGKAALKDCANLTHELIAMRSPEQLWSACSIASGPALERAEACGRRLHEILGMAGAGWSQFTGLQAADIQQLFGLLLEGAGKSMPQDPGKAAALLGQWIAGATAGIESVQKASMQLAELTDANWKALSSRAGNPG